MGNDRFDAASSALGYAYQWRLGLLVLLQAMRDDLRSALTIERIDDLSLSNETPVLFQTKHHQPGAGSLSDASEDLWKTIRVWCDRIATGAVDPRATTFAIVTTTEAADGSIAALLRNDDRDPDTAEGKLRNVAQNSKSASNRAAYEAFERLDESQRTTLVENMYIFDGEERIADLAKRIEREVLVAVDPKHIVGFRERLEGWWFDRVVTHLTDVARPPITAEELNMRIGDLREQYHRDSLPIDFFLAEPDGVDVDSDTRIFVHQLRLITSSSSRIEAAIRDYYRAFEQRSRWIREDLLHVGELDIYERRLVDEWKRYCDTLADERGAETEDEKREFGLRVYKWASDEAKIHIRPRCEEPYVVRGSFHILSDAQRVGWHPEFVDRLKHLLAAAS